MSLPFPGTPIILDIGSAYVKIGFAGDSAPRHVFPCITGTEKYRAVMVDVNTRSIYIGNDVMRMSGVLKVKHPIQRGTIMDWNEYYEILDYIFYSLLRLENLSEYPLLYVEQPFVQRETKEYIARVLFETHKVKSLMMIPSPLLSIFSVGLKNGLVIESGDGITWVVPVINGRFHNQAVQRLNLAGLDVNHNLRSLMMREGINISSSTAEEILKEIKEKKCYFVLDPRNPPKSTDNYVYSMSDGSVIEIPNHIFYEAPEIMFQPGMLGYNITNVPQAIIHSLELINSEYWGELLSHIVLSGGNLSYKGFEERLKQELNTLLPQLGIILKPKPELPIVENQVHKLETIEDTNKKQDVCHKCGELMDLSAGQGTCPSCGAITKIPQSTIESEANKKNNLEFNGKCPYCDKDIKDELSIFCPYCGKNIQQLNVPKNTREIKEETQIANKFTKFKEIVEIIKLYIPNNLQFAIFNGAAKIGALSTIQNYFITYEEFQSNPDMFYKDISNVLFR